MVTRKEATINAYKTLKDQYCAAVVYGYGTNGNFVWLEKPIIINQVEQLKDYAKYLNPNVAVTTIYTLYRDQLEDVKAALEADGVNLDESLQEGLLTEATAEEEMPAEDVDREEEPQIEVETEPVEAEPVGEQGDMLGAEPTSEEETPAEEEPVEEEPIEEEPTESTTKEKVNVGDIVRINWPDNNIWNGKTGKVISDNGDETDLGIVVVRVEDFPSSNGLQPVEQNFERRYVKLDNGEEPVAEEEPIEDETIGDIEVPVEEGLNEEMTIDQAFSDDNLEKVLDDVEEEKTESLTEDQEEKICCICGEPINGYGNNAAPVCDGLCCDVCNRIVVIPARLKGLVNFDAEGNDDELEFCDREECNIPDDDMDYEADVSDDYADDDFELWN